ncbi:fasciclin domain-containing protein [Kordia sp.]|uniref:fasciclin domain-containing protein n=1 Tax=Kordia sp. TaxID=1965332 RepID=UPI003B5BBBC7
MKKKTTSILMAFVIAVFALTSCSDDDNNVAPPASNTIADFVAANSSFSSLGAALDRADLTGVLAGTTDYTVFAPDNAAFDAFLAANGFANLEAVPVDVLTQILLNHVVSGINTSSDLSTGYIETLAEETTTGNKLNMYVNTSSGVVLNGASTVTTANVDVDNGVIHAVNNVIGLPTVVTFATADATFGVLVDALTRENTFTYVGTLSTTGTPAPFTVFAPTDAAFTDLIGELDGVNSLADIPTATLEATLNTHVVAGANVLASTLTDGMMVNTLGDNFTINTAGGATFTDLNNRTGDIIVTDVQAVNGVIHVVNKVILPNLN